MKVLLVRSGNQCAFPHCAHPLFNDDNLFVAQLCHIEAVSPGGARYNQNQTDEQRNAYSNLLFMCYRHHKETDCEEKFTVPMLHDIKNRHECRFVQEPFDVELSMVFQIEEEMKKYWGEVRKINSEDNTGLRMEVDSDASFSDLIDEFNVLINSLANALEGIAKDEDTLYETTIKFLKELNYDTKKIEETEYYNNPLIGRNWELHNIGWPNWINKMQLRLKQIEIKYYEKDLALRPSDVKIKQQLNRAKDEFRSMVDSYEYID